MVSSTDLGSTRSILFGRSFATTTNVEADAANAAALSVTPVISGQLSDPPQPGTFPRQCTQTAPTGSKRNRSATSQNITNAGDETETKFGVSAMSTQKNQRCKQAPQARPQQPENPHSNRAQDVSRSRSDITEDRVARTSRTQSSNQSQNKPTKDGNTKERERE